MGTERTDPRQAVVDMASAIKSAAKDYTRSARKKAWKSLTSSRGKEEMDKILNQLSRPISRFRFIHFENLNFKDFLEDSSANAERYFSIGHGDFDDEYGFEPDYIVWAFIDGQIEVSPTVKINRETGEPDKGHTHGSVWGHHITDRTYKGRYEPQTGRLSIVKPRGKEHLDIPGPVYTKLRQKFEKISNVEVF